MVGNIMADQSISLNNSVTVHGRALARIGAVTLINDTFTAPSCVPSAAPVPAARPPDRRPQVPTATAHRRPPPRPHHLTPPPPPHRRHPASRRSAAHRAPARCRAAAASSGSTGWLVGLFGVAGIASMASLVLVRRRPATVRSHCRSIGGLTAAHRLVTTLLVAGGVVACWAARALLVASGVEPDTAASPPSNRRPRPPPPVPAPRLDHLPFPPRSADSWLSMRAGPVPVPIELHVPTLGIHAQVLGVGVTDRGEMDAPQGTAGDPVWETRLLVPRQRRARRDEHRA